jgi:hypothetical protein
MHPGTSAAVFDKVSFAFDDRWYPDCCAHA